ncbi:short-chain dehydrogenase reductase [Seiridium cupressi]
MASKVTLNAGTALVTGAAGGIGRETALAFAEAGVEAIVFADINETGARDAAKASQKYAKHPQYRSLALKVDISDESSAQSMVDATVKEFGRIDYSVNSAGLGNISGAATPDLNIDVFSKTLEVNIKGTMLCVRGVTKVMAEQEPLTYTGRHGTRSLGRGSIVNLGSVNSYVVAPGMMPYTTSKHAIIRLTKSVAIDCFASYIRVNAVCPSWVDTPMMQASLQRVPQLEPMIKTISPLHRAATVEEVADYISNYSTTRNAKDRYRYGFIACPPLLSIRQFASCNVDPNELKSRKTFEFLSNRYQSGIYQIRPSTNSLKTHKTRKLAGDKKKPYNATMSSKLLEQWVRKRYKNKG